MEVDDASSSALTDSHAWKGHSSFAKSTRATDEIAHFWVNEEFMLKGGIVFIRQFGDGLGKSGEFNKYHTV